MAFELVGGRRAYVRVRDTVHPAQRRRDQMVINAGGGKAIWTALSGSAAHATATETHEGRGSRGTESLCAGRPGCRYWIWLR